MSENPVSAVLKMLPYGFYALSSHHNGDDNIMVVNWFTQASFEPQLVAVALQKTSHTFGLVEKSGVFALNLLRKEDKEVIKGFTKGRAKNPEKMEGAQYSPGPETGCPILNEAAAYLECKVVDKLNTGGDHDIILGEVVNAEIRKPSAVNDILTLPAIGWSYAG